MSTIVEMKGRMRAGRWAWQLFGILVGTATLVSLIKNGFAIDVYGLPAKVYADYAWLRDNLFHPVAWVFAYFGLSLPWWAKDGAMAYGLVAATHFRSSCDTSDREKAFDAAFRPEVLPFKKDYTAIFLKWAALWPIYLLAIDVPGIIYAMGTWKARKNARERDHPKRIRFDSFAWFAWALLWNSVMITIGSMAFFLWNHLTNIYGAGG